MAWLYQRPHMPRERVLIVEDYQQLRELMQTVLQEKGGYAVETANNGEVAECMVLNKPFDLVVLDIGLPGKLSGMDVAKLVRARLHCPILFISGRDPTADCPHCVEPGDRYLRKPFSMNALLVEVSGLVGGGMSTEVNPPAPRREADGTSEPRSRRHI
jgi:DNA-binding response OmpR family regulator